MSTAIYLDKGDVPCPPDCEDRTVDEVCDEELCPVHAPYDVLPCAGVGHHHGDCRDECDLCVSVMREDFERGDL